MRVVKIVAWLLGLAVTAVVVAAIAVALFIDPNDYKDDVARAVRDATGRELEIRGDIELSLFPWLGLETGAVTLANPPGFGDEPMLSIDHAAVRLRLLPLLGRQIEADTVVITGLRLRLITDAEGRSNWADLTGAGGEPDDGGSAAGSSAAVAGALAIQGIDISDGLIVWDDRASGVRYEVADLDINTGAIRPDSPIPIAVELRFTGSDVPELTLAARTEAFVELAARSGRLENLTAQLGGAVAANLTADAIDMAHETRTLGARGVALRAEQAYGTVGVDVPELDMDLDALAAAARRVSASLQGESIDVRVALEALDVDLAQGTLTGRTMTGGGRVQDTDLELTLPALDGALAGRTVHTRDMVLNARRGALQASASLPAVAFDGLAQTLSVPAFTLNAAGTELSGAIEGSALIDAPRVSGRIDGRSASLRGLLQALELETATADPNVLAAATLSAEFAASTESASLTKLQGAIDDVTFAGRIQLTRFDPPAFDAELDLGRLVLDRYLPPPATGQTVAAQDAAAAAAAPVGLGALDATARIRVEQLVMQQAGYVVDNFEISTTAKGDADAYPATVSGTLRGTALPEAIAVAARSSIALEAERLGLRELRLEARGATLAASMSTPALALNLDDGSARVDDVAAALSYAGTEAELRLGRLTLAPGGTALEAADFGGELALAGMRTELAVPALRGDLASGAYTISNAALQIAGPQRSAGRVVVPALAVDVSSQTFEANDLYFESDAGRIDASVSGARILETPSLSGGLRAQDFDLRRLLTDLGVDLDTADPDALRRTSIEADFGASAGAISVKPLIVTIDDTRIEGFIEQPDAASAAYRFELDVDDFDADRYTSKVAADAEPQANAAAAIVLPVALMRDVNANGRLRVGRLKSAGLEISAIDVTMASQDGLIELDPIRASLYEGTSDGAITVDARGAQPRVTVRERLVGVQLGPALSAAGVTDRLTGVGSLALDLSASGIDTAALTRTLDGSVRFDFRDGAMKGVDLRKVVVQARALYEQARGREVTVEPVPEDETRFSEMTGSLIIGGGVARNEDLDLKSPLLRVRGAGSASLVDQRVDYLMNVNVVGSLKGQSGETLEELEGVTIPIRISGPLDAPSYEVDLGKLVEAQVRKEIEEERDQALEKLQKKIEEKLGDKLKKLFD